MSQWKVVVVSFVTATTFWFFNSLNKNYSTDLNYPIEFVFDTDSLIAVKKLPSDVRLDVSGGGWSLLKKTAIFSPDPLEIPLSNPTAIRSLPWLEILPQVREQIKDLTIERILEDTITVQIEQLMNKWVRPVVDSSKITMEKNYRIVSAIALSNDSVLLRGPKSFIDTVQQDFAIALDETDIDESMDESFPVIPADNYLVSATPEQTTVTFEVREFFEEELEIAVDFSNFPADSSFIPSQPTVLVRYLIEDDSEEEFNAEDFILTADYNMLRTSDSSVLVMLVGFPEKALDIQINPEIINVIVNE